MALRGFFLALVSLVFAAQAVAADFRLQFPLKCEIGKTCWIVNYMDDAKGPDARDYACGIRTYDGHDGTDIGLPDRVAMETGTDVLAAAAGKVLRIRDSVEDKEPTEEEMAALEKANRGCGNGILIDHGDGWQTIYCHMKQNSIRVRPGQAVSTGDVLGQAGQSGSAQFPHLHLGVLRQGDRLDPFTGMKNDTGCAQQKTPLWADNVKLPYEPVIAYAAGFHKGVPDFEAVKIDASSPRMLSGEPGALVFWSAFYGVRTGDRISLSISDPSGHVIATNEVTQDKDRARQFLYVGRKGEKGFAPGSYKGTASVRRDGKDGQPVTRTIERDVLLK